MKTHFIKGTNKQYSIREDGIVTRHWFIHSSGTKSYKKRILKGYLAKDSNTLKVGINNKEYYVKSLMIYYFKIKNPYGIDVPLIYKDNNPLNCSLINLYYREPKEKTPVEYYHSNKEKYLIMRNNLPKHYVASNLKIKVKDLSDDLYKLQVANIKVKRLLSSKLNIHINSFQK